MRLHQKVRPFDSGAERTGRSCNARGARVFAMNKGDSLRGEN
jgi:hypothetical protein